MRTRERRRAPDFNKLLANCKLTVGRRGMPFTHPAGSAPRTHHWSVLTPQSWPPLPDVRWREEVSGRTWYEGDGTSEEDARSKACDVLGRCLGARIAQMMGERTQPARRIPAKNLLES